MKYVVILSLLFSSAAMAAPSRAPREPAAPRVAPEIAAFEAGTAALLQLDFRRAERELRRALRTRESFAEAHNNLAFVLRKQGPSRFEEALRHYQRAIELNAGLAEAHMYLGVLYVQMGNAELAQAQHARLLELNEDLAAELAWVIENGREKEPAQFFGVVRAL